MQEKEKNLAAVYMGKRKWEVMTPEQQKAHIQKMVKGRRQKAKLAQSIDNSTRSSEM